MESPNKLLLKAIYNQSVKAVHPLLILSHSGAVTKVGVMFCQSWDDVSLVFTYTLFNIYLY